MTHLVVINALPIREQYGEYSQTRKCDDLAIPRELVLVVNSTLLFY